MTSHSTEGIVIKSINFGESDRIITLLTPYKGKISAIAKGTRKISSRRGSNLDLFNHLKIQLSGRNSLEIITEAESLNSFKILKENLAKISYAYYAVEIINEFLAFGQGGKAIFDLLANFLKVLNKEKNSLELRKALKLFELKLLEYCGFGLQLNACVVCRSSSDSKIFISPEMGGLVHKNCFKEQLSVKPISEGSLADLRSLQDRENVVISLGSLQEIEKLLTFYLEYHLEKELKTPKLLSLRALQA
jgi:DNA repair protein RecO (recombination protein O)